MANKKRQRSSHKKNSTKQKNNVLPVGDSLVRTEGTLQTTPEPDQSEMLRSDDKLDQDELFALCLVDCNILCNCNRCQREQQRLIGSIFDDM